MRPFRIDDGRVRAGFDPAEAVILTDLLEQLRSLLAARRAARSDDPLAGLTGLAVGPSAAPEDPAVARLLPDFHRDDTQLASGMRMLHEPEVIAAKDDAARTVLAQLPADGGEVSLDQSSARQWMVALNDLRLALGTRLGIVSDDEVPEVATGDPRGGEYAMYLTYQWLSAVLESLTRALLEQLGDDRP